MVPRIEETSVVVTSVVDGRDIESSSSSSLFTSTSRSSSSSSLYTMDPPPFSDCESVSSTNKPRRRNHPIMDYENPNKAKSSSSNGGELYSTIASSVLLFFHFGITLYKINHNDPNTSVGKIHMKEKWLFINILIVLYTITSYNFRTKLTSYLHYNNKVKCDDNEDNDTITRSTSSCCITPAILIPDVCTFIIVLLLLTKHMYLALFTLMVSVTFLALATATFDIMTYLCTKATTSGDAKVSPKQSNGNSDDSIECEAYLGTTIVSWAQKIISLITQRRSMTSSSSSSMMYHDTNTSGDSNTAALRMRKKAQRSIVMQKQRAPPSSPSYFFGSKQTTKIGSPQWRGLPRHV